MINSAEYSPANRMWFVLSVHRKTQDGLVYICGTIKMPTGGKGALLYGADGPVRVWVNGKPAGCQPKATNPIVLDQYRAAATWKKGRNEILFDLDTNKGQAWGVCARGER